MKKERDIFELFKNSQHRLDERPSRHAWAKLESKLDSHRAKHRSMWYRQLAMAATLLALVAFISLLSIVLMPESEKATASADFFPLELEDLTTSGTSNAWSKAVALTDSYNSININEGSKDKKIKVLTNVPKSVPITPEPLVAESKPKLFADMGASEKEDTETSLLKDEITFEGAAENAGFEVDWPETTKSLEYTVEEDIVPIDTDDATLEMATEAPASPPVVLSDSEEYVAVKEIAKSKKAESDIVNYGATKRAATSSPSISLDPSIQPFQWMVGSWSAETDQGLSYEEWSIQDPFSIVGQGYVLIDGQRTFMEKMEIRNVNGELYFITTLDTTGVQSSYKLHSLVGGQAIFNNDSQAFPNQVILQQNDPDEFTTILQNAGPSNMSSSQADYLRNRNYIQQEQAVRNLSRVRN